LKLSARLFNEHNVTIDVINCLFLHPAENGAISLWSVFDKDNTLNRTENSALGYTIYCVRYFLERREIYINGIVEIEESPFDRLSVYLLIIGAE
jgi:hypothetical protein